MDCFGSPTRKRPGRSSGGPSSAIQPSSEHCTRSVSWNSSTRSWSIPRRMRLLTSGWLASRASAPVSKASKVAMPRAWSRRSISASSGASARRAWPRSSGSRRPRCARRRRSVPARSASSSRASRKRLASVSPSARFDQSRRCFCRFSGSSSSTHSRSCGSPASPSPSRSSRAASPSSIFCALRSLVPVRRGPMRSSSSPAASVSCRRKPARTSGAKGSCARIFAGRPAWTRATSASATSRGPKPRTARARRSGSPGSP